MSVTKNEVLAKLEEAVAENGADHTAECKYARNNQPHCIAGVVLAKLGASVSQLSEMDWGFGSLSEYEPEELGIEKIEEATGVELDVDAYNTLAQAQLVQDSGYVQVSNKSWGTALEVAREA